MTTAPRPHPRLDTPRTRAALPALGRAETAVSSDTTRETARNAKRDAGRTGVTGVDRLDTGRASARCRTREAVRVGSGAGRDPGIGARVAEGWDTTKGTARARSPRTVLAVHPDAMDRAEFVDGLDTSRVTVATPDAVVREGTITDREDETKDDGKRNNPVRRTCVTDAVKRATGRRSVRNRITDRKANEAEPRQRISVVDAAKPGTMRATVRNRRITRAESASKRGTLLGIVRTRKKRPRIKPQTWMPISITT